MKEMSVLLIAFSFLIALFVLAHEWTAAQADIIECGSFETSESQLECDWEYSWVIDDKTMHPRRYVDEELIHVLYAACHSSVLVFQDMERCVRKKLRKFE